MRILVVGSGGREHALAWKLAQEAEVFACPGSYGLSRVAECVPGDVVEIAAKLRPDLVVVGPENPLIDGLADRLRVAGFATFGPGAAGARLEASKAYAKDMMVRAGVPTAAHRSFTDATLARDFVRERFAEGREVAVKASGAALGKGVVVAHTLDEADEAISMMMEDRDLGEAGETVVIEDRLVGREFSLLTVCSDGQFVSLPVAQDYKRALDGDRGPNTGGMGSISPVPWVSSTLIARTEERVVAPILAALNREGVGYRGLLFSGLMVVDDEPYCLEYNVRFGDPETQSVVRRLGSGFADLLHAAALGETLPAISVQDNHAITVVVASGGYPGEYETGKAMSLFQPIPHELVLFFAGTRKDEGYLQTSGGRVLGVSAAAETPERARRLAYDCAAKVEFPGAYYRTDIGA